MVQLDVELREATSSLRRLDELHASLGDLPVKYRKVVAELMLLRLFDVLQFRLKRIVCKVACGAEYLDGTSPVVLHTVKSARGAETAMETHLRAKPRRLNWSKVGEIKKNARFIIDVNDHLMVTLDRNGQIFDEMRRVRNRVAHKNEASRKAYRVVVRRKYGAKVKGVTPGTLLLTDRWGAPTMLERYVGSTKLLLRTLLRA